MQRQPDIRPYQGKHPQIAATAYVDSASVIIGDVVIGEDASVWPLCVVRGDVNFIRIGARTNIQDGSTLHVMKDEYPLILGDDITVGHSVTLHGCTIERHCLVGIGAIVLNGAVVGEESIVAAGALVTEGMQVPPRSVVMGAPAKVKREVTEEERAGLRQYAERYVRYKDEYRAEAGE